MPTLVLVVASGASWEPEALRVLTERPGVVVLKRCVDVDDLLAAATAGQADVAVVDLGAPGLDSAAVTHLHAHGVRPVAVAAGDQVRESGRLLAARIGITRLVVDTELAQLADLVERAGLDPSPPVADGVAPRDPADGEGPEPGTGTDGTRPPVARPGSVVAVWGPAGAPGRTTLASAMAAELAARRLPTVLVDADPYGGTVAQLLGVLDEVSGLLAAARLATAGQLEDRIHSVQRQLAPGLALVTGLPRPDRWSEVRVGALEHLLELLRGAGHVVVDAGFCLEEDPFPDLGGRPGRNHLTLATLTTADAVVAVGSADPVGLSRLARGLAELHERVPGTPVHVVVNRMRGSLGWSEGDVAAMVAQLADPASLHFVPDDPATVDRAAVAGRTLRETDADSAAARAVAAVTAAVVPAAADAAAAVTGRARTTGLLAGRQRGAAVLSGLRPRTAGRGRPR